MDKYEENLFNKIQFFAKLVMVNWNALKVNPPCEKNIIDALAALNEHIKMMSEHHDIWKRYRENHKERQRGKICPKKKSSKKYGE